MERKLISNVLFASSQFLFVACNYLQPNNLPAPTFTTEPTPKYSQAPRTIFFPETTYIINPATGEEITIDNQGPRGLFVVFAKKTYVFSLFRFEGCTDCKINEKENKNINEGWTKAFRITNYRSGIKGNPIQIAPVSPWDWKNKK